MPKLRTRKTRKSRSFSKSNVSRKYKKHQKHTLRRRKRRVGKKQRRHRRTQKRKQRGGFKWFWKKINKNTSDSNDQDNLRNEQDKLFKLRKEQWDEQQKVLNKYNNVPEECKAELDDYSAKYNTAVSEECKAELDKFDDDELEFIEKNIDDNNWRFLRAAEKRRKTNKGTLISLEEAKARAKEQASLGDGTYD